MNVSSTYLAQVLRITTRRVRQLVDEGVIERDEKTGKYNLPNCVYKYFEFKYANENPVDASYERERSLHEKAKRERTELILAQMKGELHAAEDVEREMTDMLVTVRTKLRGVPTRIAPALLAQTSLSVVEDIMLSAIDESLTALASYSPELFANPGLYVLDEGDEDDESEEGDEPAGGNAKDRGSKKSKKN